MSDRLQTICMRRTTAKRRITNVVNRFNKVKNEENAQQTVTDLRSHMRKALMTFQDIDRQLLPLLEAAEANASLFVLWDTKCSLSSFMSLHYND